MKKPDQSIIPSLLEKHALGICTPEEMALLEQWYAAFPEKGSVWSNEQEKAALKGSLKADIFRSITSAKVVPVSPRRNWWKAAAVVAVLLGIYALYNKYNYKKEPVYVVVSAEAGKGILQHQLPDHSEVWLEPGTTIRYRKDFVNDVREIELKDGMVFFSVRKDAQHPFLVKTPNGVQTKVLGTEFTVKAYSQLNEVQVMVRSGIVQVCDSTRILDTLRTNQQLSYRQQEHLSKRTEGALQDWRTGEIVLNNAPFTEVARLLETHYGLQVAYNTKAVFGYTFTLQINKQTTAAEMLDMLKEISGLQYEINNGKVTIH